MSELSLVPLGDGAVRFPVPAEVDAAALLERLRAWPGVRDAVVTETHAAVSFDPAAPPVLEPAALLGLLDDVCRDRGRGSPREVAIKVRYGGEDLAAVAAAAGLSPGEVVALHVGRSYEVRLIGFLPGFAYLGGVDPRIVLPRRPAPRPRVPAGAVAIAGPYTGIYPMASAGGWHLIGSAVDFLPFTAEAGAELRLGDRVRFVPVGP
ncbi:MAG TPA: carboxyltransferase domain-containing protein [Polyangia bacterium]|nr:carboxyltransferase domain-containing protein [Polyangia bacterium]